MDTVKETKNETKIKSLIKDSGNSDVDVNIQIEIETKSIAYAMLCSQYAKGDLNELEFERAIKKLKDVIDRDVKQDRKEQGISESRPNLFQIPQSNNRRSWI